jgi:SsrA-binding protein
MTGGKGTKGPEVVFATNRKAGRDYEILESFEAGLALRGTEIKAIRQRRVSLDDSFARIEGGQLVLYNMYVSPYEHGGLFNVEPVRVRRLLMHRSQIDRLEGLVRQKRLTVVPLRLYQSRGVAKVELALARGRRQYEKRDRLRDREVERDIQRRMRKTKER